MLNLFGIILDHIPYFFNKKYTILQACHAINLDIPIFCYHEKLGIAGNCRMCLVESNTSKKLVVSCATVLEDDMFISTYNLRVYRAREGVLEFLLLGHPLDCPICDQGGECDLQDITLVYGLDRNRYYEYKKRAVEDKDIGPFVKTFMTRCIHCTRCIRFLTEIAADFNFGLVSRGSDLEITTYIENDILHELSANIVDLCPVGALTAKPYTFKARPWEAKWYKSIDFMDGICSNIRIDVFNNKISRILPVSNLQINDDWITNKTRFAFEGIYFQRLVSPLFTVEKSKYQVHVKCSWQFIFNTLGLFLMQRYIKRVLVTLGDFLDLSTVLNTKYFLNYLSVSTYTDHTFNVDKKSNFLLNDKLISLDMLDAVVLCGFNPRLENPLFNLKLRKNFIKKNLVVYSFGFSLINLTYESIHLGNFLNIFLNFFYGLSEICELFFKYKKVKFFCGTGVLYRNDFSHIQRAFEVIMSKLNLKDIVGYVFPFSGELNKLDVGLFNGVLSDVSSLNLSRKLNFYIGDCFRSLVNSYLDNVVNVYFGLYGDYFSKKNILALPALSPFEYDGYFMNIEGVYGKTIKVFNNKSNIRKISTTLQALIIFLFKYYNNIINSNYLFMYFFDFSGFLSHFVVSDEQIEIKKLFLSNPMKNFGALQLQSVLNLRKWNIKIVNNILTQIIFNFYVSDAISIHSKVMNISANAQFKNNFTYGF